MPTVLLKLLALSGVISAGCFAVWKANTELQPISTADATQFTALEGEPEEGVGLGGQPIPKATMSRAMTAEAESTETEPTEDNLLAMADPAFARGAFPVEHSTPRGMPAAFPPEQDEPSVAVTPEPSEPEPGVSSLEVLEAAEPTPTPTPAIRTRTVGGAAPQSAVLNSQPLNRFPAEAGAPVLITIPKPKLTQSADSSELPRSRTPSRIVPANAEDFGDSSLEYVPDVTDESSFPSEFSAQSEPVQVAPSRASPVLNPQLGGRTRGPAIPAPQDIAEPDLDTSPWGDSAIESIETPDAVDEPALIEARPAARPFAPRNRTSQPTPIEEVPTPELEFEPAPLNLPANRQPGRTPTNTHAVGQDQDEAPAAKSSIPSNNLPARTITPEMLIGDATVEDPLLTPTQQPQLRIEKRAQAEAEVGEKFVYEIIVQNVGSVPAQYVVVEERIAKGTRMERSQPQAHIGRDRILRWELETMAPNTEQVIKVEVTPLEAGPIGSVATVRFAARVASKTVVTAPTLSLSIKHPPEVAVGELVPLKFVITNTGTGTARKATLRAVLQEGLHHPAGLDLDQDLGTLAPGQAKEIDLAVTASEQGRYTPSVIVTANGVEQENRTLDLSVIESRLTLSRDGHVRRFVNRPAEFTTKVTNHSVETMKNVIITEQLPEGVTPVGETGKFRWTPRDRTVTWTVSELGPGQYSDLKLSVVAERAGRLIGKVQAVSATGHRAELGTQLDVQGFSSLTLDFQGDGKAVAVGDQVSMRVTVGNKGTAPAMQVQALFELPPQMQLVSAKGPVSYTQEGKYVTFAALEELAPNSNQTFDIVLTAAEEGRPLVGVELLSTDLPQSIHQQESVTITP